MKNIFGTMLILLTLGGCVSSGLVQTNARVVEDFNAGWRFALGDSPVLQDSNYDDSAWRQLDLPHDWSIESDFGDKYPSTAGGGALPGGIGWYRKQFTPQTGDASKSVYIDFDGVYWNSKVWINGQLLGERPSGYISFRYDLTPYVKFGEPNTIAVRVDNSKQPNSRWYSGSGIYRNVKLVTVDPVHVAHFGTYVTTHNVCSKSADVKVQTTIENSGSQSRKVELVSVVIDAQGKVTAKISEPVSVQGGGAIDVEQTLWVKNPELWSDTNPYMYSVVTHVVENGAVIDDYKSPLGIRYFEFDNKKGFLLNGKQVKIKGVCMHHDLGCLGSAVNYRAIERQLEILKQMGCNGIRTSHNPPAPELLELCDKMGFIVQSEIFDMWHKRKSTHDYSQYFAQWHERDIESFIMRDRNHPSVFMWSIGNEILEQWSNVEVDTLDIQQANLLFNFASSMSQDKISDSLHLNSLLTIKLAEKVRALDATRPVTSGNNEARPTNHLFASGVMDIIGVNYNDKLWSDLPQMYPNNKYIITESTSSLMSRGYYEMPSDEINIRPDRWDVAYFKHGNQCSSYDNSHVPWGTTHEQTWKQVRDADFIAGIYVWTGFDYLGEPTPYWWPSRSSYFGIVDLAGFPKDVYYMYQSEWTDKDVLHLFPHWNWTLGDSVDVWAYYNNADQVELFLNGQSLGARSKIDDELHVWWRVPYQSGTLKAVSSKNGKEILVREIKTAGEPSEIRLTADRSNISSEGKDMSFITAEVLDTQGNVVPNADNEIHFRVDGNGFIAGTDNGNPTDHNSLKKPVRRLFNGKALVVVQSNGIHGDIVISATSTGLAKAMIKVKADKNNK